MRTNALRHTTRAVALLGVPLLLGWLVAAPILHADEGVADPASDNAFTDASNTTATDMSAVDEAAARANAGDAASAAKPVVAQAPSSDVSVTPVVANEKAKPRDIIKKELLVTNNTGQRIDLYIAVHNIDPASGEEAFDGPTTSDLSTSLANWIEITRGVIELGPNESRKIPYLIHVNLTAKPGSYFARIGFYAGTTRSEAEARPVKADLTLNLEVEDDAHEQLSLGNFIAKDSVVFGDSADFSYLLENTGNRDVEPRGSIRIFDRRGEEVGSVPINADGSQITPDAQQQLAAVWSTAGRFGKYKAYLDLQYGNDQTASVQDTVYFWVFPWKEITAALFGVIVLAVIGTYIVHMRAVARPTPARIRTNVPNAPTVPEPSSAAVVRAQTAAVLTPRPTLRTASARPASVGSSPSELLARVQRAGDTVQLAPRAPAGRPQRHGDTIQLSSRR